MYNLFKKSISFVITVIYATGAMLLVSPNVVQAAFTCAATSAIFSDLATCQAGCRVPLTCSTGDHAVSGNSTLYNNPFNKIVWGVSSNTANSGFPTAVVTKLSWIDFQNTQDALIPGTSGGKLYWGYNGDKVEFSNAITPARNEIFSAYRPLIGVKSTSGTSLEFLMLNTTTNQPEVVGAIPTNGTVAVTGGTHQDTSNGRYTQVTRVATDTNHKTMMLYGALPTGNETTVAEVKIIPAGTPQCPILYEPGNPSNVYTCDANNQCNPPGRCDQVSGVSANGSVVCSKDLNGNGTIDQSEFAECGHAVRVDLAGSPAQATATPCDQVANPGCTDPPPPPITVLPPTGTDTCPVGAVDCNTSCPGGYDATHLYSYVKSHDRCEMEPQCPTGMVRNPTTNRCEMPIDCVGGTINTVTGMCEANVVCPVSNNSAGVSNYSFNLTRNQCQAPVDSRCPTDPDGTAYTWDSALDMCIKLDVQVFNS